MLHQASNGVKSKDKLRAEKSNLSNADLHHEVRKSAKDALPIPLRNPQKLCDSIKATKEDELIKYMSKLPSYLGRRENPKEKVLNVGVLEWGRLEKWQHSHKQVPHRSSISSLCSSNTSSSFSTDESSSHASRGDSCSPSRQRRHRSSLQVHVMSSPSEGLSQVVKPISDNFGKFQDLKPSWSNTLSKQEKFVIDDKPLCGEFSEIELEGFKKKGVDSKTCPDNGTFSHGRDHGKLSFEKVKYKVRDGRFMKRMENFPAMNPNNVDHDVPGRNVARLLPSDLPSKNYSVAPNPSEVNTKSDGRETKPSECSSLEKFEGAYRMDLNSDFPCPRRLEHKANGNPPQMKASVSLDAKCDNISSEQSHSLPLSAKIGTNSYRQRTREEKKLCVMHTKSATNALHKGSGMTVSKVASEKPRSTSPFCRYNFGINKISKSSKNNSEGLAAGCAIDASCSEKTNTGRARSSPLRRLLDPLLKPKAVNCQDVSESSQKDSISADRLVHSPTVTAQTATIGLDTTSCDRTNANNSSQARKHGVSVVQALLRVQIKNGLPLFTFAVDNESTILAATVKTFSTPREDNQRCIYTFFSIQEAKRKNGKWLSQGGKVKGQDYVHKIVAQMKVSGSEYHHLSRQNSANHARIREFVLLSLDAGLKNEGMKDFKSNDELAAIVIKIPERFTESPAINEYQTARHQKHNGLCEAGSEEYLPEAKVVSNSSKGGLLLSLQGISATVILPNGIHSLPNKGGPSSLIQRYKSGGSCDCGGWDLGCKLTILSDSNQLDTTSVLPRGPSIAGQFELFLQGTEDNDKPFFRLAPFKDGVCSAEFDPSVSLMQAFSICIAVYDSWRILAHSKANSGVEESNLGEATFLQEDGITKAPCLFEGEVPARFVSFPPHSPVGRV